MYSWQSVHLCYNIRHYYSSHSQYLPEFSWSKSHICEMLPIMSFHTCNELINCRISLSLECCVQREQIEQSDHDDVIEWKHFPRHWPFVRGIHRLPVNSPHKGQWCGDLMFSLICAWTNSWTNNADAGDLRRHRAHYDAIVMFHRCHFYDGSIRCTQRIRSGALTLWRFSQFKFNGISFVLFAKL